MTLRSEVRDLVDDGRFVAAVRLTMDRLDVPLPRAIEFVWACCPDTRGVFCRWSWSQSRWPRPR